MEYTDSQNKYPKNNNFAKNYKAPKNYYEKPGNVNFIDFSKKKEGYKQEVIYVPKSENK